MEESEEFEEWWAKEQSGAPMHLKFAAWNGWLASRERTARSLAQCQRELALCRDHAKLERQRYETALGFVCDNCGYDTREKA